MRAECLGHKKCVIYFEAFTASGKADNIAVLYLNDVSSCAYDAGEDA